MLLLVIQENVLVARRRRLRRPTRRPTRRHQLGSIPSTSRATRPRTRPPIWT